MSGSWLQCYAKCPFYIKDDGRTKIVCEGHYPTSRSGYTFGSAAHMRSHFQHYCADTINCRSCIMHRSTMHWCYPDYDQAG